MTATTTASVLPQNVWGATSARNTANLAYHPPMGGMPASDVRAIVMATVSPGAYWNSPPNESISADWVLRATAITTAKAARFMAA